MYYTDQIARIDSVIARDSEVTSAVSTHAGLTATHGATGATMGTTNTQTVTNKTMGSGCAWGGTAVPVANGGTGKTTAAEALAALGGASLNGSSTVDFQANDLGTAGFTTLGELGTGVKMTVATGTTGIAGAAVSVAHGLVGSKILAFSAKVEYGANSGVPPEFTSFTDYNYSVYHDDTNFYVANKVGASAGIAEKPFKILIWYME